MTRRNRNVIRGYIIIALIFLVAGTGLGYVLFHEEVYVYDTHVKQGPIDPMIVEVEKEVIELVMVDIPKIPSTNEVILLARLIQSEALGEPYKGKVAVGEVVLNRLSGPSYVSGDRTLEGVVYKKGQFDGIGTNLFSMPLKAECIIAAIDAMDGDKYLDEDVIYFFNPETSTDLAFVNSRGLERVERIGNHVFLKEVK